MSTPAQMSVNRPTLSIIIPALDEAQTLPALLNALSGQQNICFEVIVADGGSSDRTGETALALGARVVTSRRGRGRQMNAGARVASGKLLLFLHADADMDSPRQLAAACQALERHVHHCGHRRVAGHFALSFRREKPGHELHYRYMAAKTGLNRRHTINGDQGLLIFPGFFNKLGGFHESLPFLEDQCIAGQIRCQGEWITLPGRLHTSARRFELEGIHRRYILMAIIMGVREAGLVEFFARSPTVYNAPSKTDRLALSPFLDVIAALMRKRQWRERRRIWRRIGGYVRENGWQLFLLGDLAGQYWLRRARTDFRLLRFHDHFLAHRLDHPLVDRLLGALVHIWVMGVLRTYFRLSERRWRDVG